MCVDFRSWGKHLVLFPDSNYNVKNIILGETNLTSL